VLKIAPPIEDREPASPRQGTPDDRDPEDANVRDGELDGRPPLWPTGPWAARWPRRMAASGPVFVHSVGFYCGF